MTIKKRSFLLTVLMMIFAITIIGCSDKDSSGSKNDDNNSEENDKNNNNDDDKEDETNKDSVSSEDGLPIVDDKITLTVAAGTGSTNGPNWSNKEAIKILEKETNINIDFNLTPSGEWSQKRSLLLGANDLPDVLVGGTASSDHEIVDYGEQGSLIALEDLIEEHAPNIQKMLDIDVVRKAITAPDGHIYAIPSVNRSPWEETNGNMLWINQKWLDELDLPMPETLDEFKETLIAFRDNDVNGTGTTDGQVPFSFLEPSANDGLSKVIFTSFGIENSTVMVQDKDTDGKVLFPAATDEYKEAVQYLNSLWEEGLIDPQAFSYGDKSQFTANLARDPSPVGAFAGSHPDNLVPNEDTKWDYSLINPPLKGPDGHHSFAKNNPFVHRRISITSKNEHPVETIKWLNHVFSEEKSLNTRYGPNAWEYDEDDNIIMLPREEGLSESEWRHLDAPASDFVYFISDDMADRVIFKDGIENPHLLYKRPEFIDTVDGLVIDRTFPSVMFDLEELDILSGIEPTLKDFVSQKFASWITDGGIEDDWDDYLNELEKIGLDKMLDIYQDAYDRYDDA